MSHRKPKCGVRVIVEELNITRNAGGRNRDRWWRLHPLRKLRGRIGRSTESWTYETQAEYQGHKEWYASFKLIGSHGESVLIGSLSETKQRAKFHEWSGPPPAPRPLFSPRLGGL